jgi:membrane-bound lytic murein transglycosylase B
MSIDIFTHSPRPRRLPLLAAACAGAALFALAPAASAADAFAACLAQLRAPATKAGVSGATFDTHTAGLAPDMAVIGLLDAQPEFKTPIWDYMAGLVDDERVADGQAGMARWQSDLERAASRYGVDPATIAAVWGVESNYGRTLGGRPLLTSLSTLSCFGRRQA